MARALATRPLCCTQSIKSGTCREGKHRTLDLRLTFLLTHQQLHLPTGEGHYSAQGREVPRSAVLLGVDISLNLGNEAQSGCCTLESLRKACLPAFLPSSLHPFLPGEEKEQAWAHLLGVSLGALSACVWVCGEQGGEPGQEREQWLQGGSILPSPLQNHRGNVVGVGGSLGLRTREKARTKQQLPSLQAAARQRDKTRAQWREETSESPSPLPLRSPHLPSSHVVSGL